MSTDAFEQTIGERIARDRWDRPLIIPREGGKPKGYTRVSTLAKALDDTYNLERWKLRTATAGFVRKRDLLALATAKLDDRDALDRIIEDALEAGGGRERANLGTAMHSFTELVDRGGSIEEVPAEYRPDVLAYLEALRVYDLEVVAIERFIVNDEVEAAGTFDRLYRVRHTGKILLGDLKTGDHDANYPTGVTTQTAIYANGELYDLDGTRHSMAAVDKEVGLLMHLPLGRGECTVYDLDLVAGYKAAKQAVEVRAWRKAKPIRVRPKAELS